VRVEKEEITAATLKNFIKSLKVFCESTDIDDAWKKVTRGLPRGRQAANDRASTIEEVCKLVEYPEKNQANCLHNGFFWYTSWCMGFSKMETRGTNI
jgi:hypothetical protein